MAVAKAISQQVAIRTMWDGDMAKRLITTSELVGMRVMGGKNGAKRIGKIRSCVFHPKEKRCVGFIVKRPDLLWMFHRKDKFVSLGGYDFEDGRVVIRDTPDATDRAACRSLGVSWDDCVLWVGLPVMTKDGQGLGMVGSVTFDRASGSVEFLETNSGVTSNALLGKRSIPASLIAGFRRGMGAALSQSAAEGDEVVLGAILVADEAKDIPTEGGMAEKAGKATAVAADKAQTAVDKVKPVASAAAEKTGEVINKGAYATGKQISKTKTMFSDFKSEYDKATADSGKTAKAAAKKTAIKKKSSKSSSSEEMGKAIGSHMKKAGGMFSAFKEEYDKARHDGK